MGEAQHRLAGGVVVGQGDDLGVDAGPVQRPGLHEHGQGPLGRHVVPERRHRRADVAVPQPLVHREPPGKIVSEAGEAPRAHGSDPLVAGVERAPVVPHPRLHRHAPPRQPRLHLLSGHQTAGVAEVGGACLHLSGGRLISRSGRGDLALHF